VKFTFFGRINLWATISSLPFELRRSRFQLGSGRHIPIRHFQRGGHVFLQVVLDSIVDHPFAALTAGTGSARLGPSA
jgi:hypothetical protein